MRVIRLAKLVTAITLARLGAAGPAAAPQSHRGPIPIKEPRQFGADGAEVNRDANPVLKRDCSRGKVTSGDGTSTTMVSTAARAGQAAAGDNL